MAVHFQYSSGSGVLPGRCATGISEQYIPKNPCAQRKGFGNETCRSGGVSLPAFPHIQKVVFHGLGRHKNLLRVPKPGCYCQDYLKIKSLENIYFTKNLVLDLDGKKAWFTHGDFLESPLFSKKWVHWIGNGQAQNPRRNNTI